MELMELVNIEIQKLSNKVKANVINVYGAGKSSNSLHVVTKNNESSLYGRAFFATLETGRKPGKQPPVKEIMKWLEPRFNPIGQNKNIAGLAFVMARAIGERGTLLYQNGGRKDIFSNEITKFTSDLQKKMKEQILIKIGEYISVNNK